MSSRSSDLSPPAFASDWKFLNSLLVLYGMRDIFMALAGYASASFGNRKTLG